MEAQYKQAIRDVIYQAVEREIAIWEAQVKVEAILRAEWGVSE
jgi:phage baseplate assembly protein W